MFNGGITIRKGFICVLVLLVTVIVVVTSVGCGSAQPQVTQEILDRKSNPDKSLYANGGEERFYKISIEQIGNNSSIWVDRETGVEYLYIVSEANNVASVGSVNIQFIPLLDGNGKPVIYSKN